MLQVKDPQEVFDELIKPLMQSLIADLDDRSAKALNEYIYQAYVLGEIYGTISTSLAQHIPISVELWNHKAVKLMLRGDMDNIMTVDTTIGDDGEADVSKASVILLP